MSDPVLTPVPLVPELLRGALDVVDGAHGLAPHRLPARARAQADPQLVAAAAQPSGVRLALRTAATVVELDAHRTTTAFRGIAPRPDGRYDLHIDGVATAAAVSHGGDAVVIDLATGSAESRPGPPATLRFTGLPARAKDVEIWLPHQEIVELVALRADEPVGPVSPGRRVWLQHGSSISQGSNATSPSSTWAALAATAGGVELVNLGFSGSMLLDQCVARTIRDHPADLIGVEIGINLVNSDAMRLRAFTAAVHGFLDTVRDGHPTTPLLVLSPILCPMQEDTPGPATIDGTDGTRRFRTPEPTGDPTGRLTLRVVRDELARIVAERAGHDPHLHLLDGVTLYGEADHESLPLPDRLHPDAATHRLMGERFADLIFTAGGPFAP